MTDKEQIIIDGIDVSECSEYYEGNCETLNWVDFCHRERTIRCQDCPDCYFKQLARKTKEYELLARTNKIHANIIGELNNKYNDLKEDYKELEQRHNGAFQDFKRLKQECEKYKARSKSLQDIADGLQKRNHFLTLDNERLEEECRELKEEHEKLQNTWIKQSKVLSLKKKSIEALKKAVLLKENNRYIQSCFTQEKQSKYEKLLNKLTQGVVMPTIPEPEVINLTARYRKALEEIEEYTREQFCDNCEDIGSTEYTCHCEYCEYYEYFDIINKAKGENNVTSN